MAFDGIKIGVLYRNRSASGNEYFSGRLGDATLLVMENRESTPENKLPTHNVFISKPKPTNGSNHERDI